jgi:predicted  nucleic acid-binding Zn-ribbon protein
MTNTDPKPITDAELAALKAMWANLSAAEALDAADECVPRLIREVEALQHQLTATQNDLDHTRAVYVDECKRVEELRAENGRIFEDLIAAREKRDVLKAIIQEALDDMMFCIAPSQYTLAKARAALGDQP